MHGENVNALGWGLNTPTQNHFLLTQLPILSEEELNLCHEVLTQFHALPPPGTPAQLEHVLSTWEHAHHVQLEDAQRKECKALLELHAFHAGPLTELFHHSHIEEISIYGIGKHFPVRVYHAQKGWMETPLYFSSATPLTHLLNRLILETGKRLSTHTPLVNVPIPGFGRLHASISPVCMEPVEATIRRMIHRPANAEWLTQHRVLSQEALAFLRTALQVDCNLLLVGNTGSGKTTTLNTLLQLLPRNERFILIEETPELELSHAHVVRLTPDAEAQTPMPRLIRETLRMRPDRLVVGEIRHPEEAHAFMEAVLAGQGKGTYATFHGHSGKEALARLRGFGILEQDLGWINLLVVQRRWTTHGKNAVDTRAVCEVSEIFLDEQNNVVIHPVFGWNPGKQGLVEQNESILVKQKFGWCFPKKKWGKNA